MKQNNNFTAVEYLAPKVEVVEVKAPRVMCSSITGMEFGSDQDDNAFN